MRHFASVLFLACAMTHTSAPAQTPSFEVATIKPVDPAPKAGRFMRVEGTHRFVARNYTLRLLIAAAYDLNPRTISGGQGWVDTDKYEIQAVTPGETAPDHDAQMLMLRSLLAERFHLAFHRESKIFAIYEITVAKGGPKLAPSLTPEAPPQTVSVVYPDKMVMPARNATIGDLARVMQRAILDRPVVDRTGLTNRYNFNLEWAPDETQFSGDVPPPEESQSPPLLLAMRQQLGLQMTAVKGPVDTIVIDRAHKPTAN
ncbi:TIGR03435 family protein [Terriglobus roseus]|uniref:Soil-associated protein, TIGR03435 family n=1 Tax=Terriglobus roseus TaxID=392734 RepID=A0A1H4LMF9_9BACT|nr:TIGR03435 family protein [Terriglobus roseus]SEB71890.1 soil-associated protein, TIGR03435 family [Terriglobus roseus]